MIYSGDGIGGESIYGGKFEDESFLVPYNKKYQLAMANTGPDSNGSQFFITTIKTSWLDGKNVIFGKVLSGFDVIDKLEHHGTNSGTPRSTAIIVDSGESFWKLL